MPEVHDPAKSFFPETGPLDGRPASVAFVNMPLFAVDRPALGISMLKADLERHDIPCLNLYLNIPYAERIGLEFCGELDFLPRDAMAGDWIFAESLWGRSAERDTAYLRLISGNKVWEDTAADPGQDAIDVERMLRSCRHEANVFLEDCLRGVPWHRFRIVGFSCQCQQLTSSLALARRLKERDPDLVIAFGGGNCRGEMGAALLKAFPFIDAVCLGEGEGVFAEYAAAVLERRTPGAIPGLLHRHGNDPAAVAAATVPDLDRLPDPDFGDFFAQRAHYPNPGIAKLHIVVETSRGCWWGEKSQCAFCGLNVNALAYRHKSAPRAVGEFTRLLERYGSLTRSLRAADTILPKAFLDSFFPLLSQSGQEAEIFYYVRSDLTKGQLRLASLDFHGRSFC